MTAAPDSPVWQLVLVLWGTKYPVTEVNHLIATVCRHADPQPGRIILLTDRTRDGLDARAEQRMIPPYYLDPTFLSGGCQAKLCLFEPGLVPDECPAVFVDLDTVVFGNLARLLPLVKGRRRVAMLAATALRFGALSAALRRLTRGRHYARANSSIVVYHPGECADIPDLFRAEMDRANGAFRRHLSADDRFLSWAIADRIALIPRALAVKLPSEFMRVSRPLIHLRARLPRLRRRWAGLVALTLPGVEVKGAALLALPDGAEIVDRRGRRLIWSDAALGPIKARLTAYYTALEQSGGTP